MDWNPLTIVALLSPTSLLLIDSSIKGSVILLLAAGVALLLRRDSAATRHLVWLVAVVAMLFVPVFSASLPQWNVLPSWFEISNGMDGQAVVLAKPSKDIVVVSENGNVVDLPILVGHDDDRVAADAPQIAVNAMPQLDGVTSADASDLNAADVAREMNSQVSADGWSWSKAFLIIWLGGFGLLILRLFAARLLLWSNERRATVIASSTRTGALITHLGQTPDATNESIIDVFRNAVQQLGIRQDISLSLHCEKNIPLVWGLWKFRLLLPMAARDWSDEQLRSVMLHELAHLKRRDTATQLLAQFACALHWFNPLIWFASWRLHVERERACDDLVLSNGVAASAYAEHLLDVATRLTSSPWTQACGLAMAQRSSLESRLLAILSQQRNRRSLTSLVVAVWLILGTSAAVPISIMGGVEASDQGDATSEKDSRKDNEMIEDNKSTDEIASNLIKRWHAFKDLRAPQKKMTVERMRYAIDSWIMQPVKPDVDAGKALRDWQRERNQHPEAELFAWLDQLAASNPELQFAINGQTRVSRQLTDKELSVLNFGPVAENGLRAAWRRSPLKDAYRIGDVVRSTLVIQNTTKQTIEFKCVYSLNRLIQWNVKTEAGRKVNVTETWLTGIDPVYTFRVKPGQVVEIMGYGGVTIGETESRAITRLNAREGELVTVQMHVSKPVQMKTGAISFNVVASAPTGNTETTPPVPSAKSSKAGVKLDDKVEDKLKWGKTVNGLRAAIMIRDTPQVSNEIFIVVQNASENPIRIDDSADVHEQTLYIKRNGRIVSALSSTRSKAGGVLLQPRQTVSVPVFSPTSKVEQNGEMLSSILAKTAQNDPSITLYAKVNFENVASGTWKGTLQTGEVTGVKAAASNFKGGKEIVTGKTSAAVAKEDPMPKSKTAQALFKQWQTNARLNGKIPGGALRSLVKATSNFVELNSTDKRAPALTELLKRMDVSRDWTLQEAVDLLDDVTDVYDNLPKWAADLSRFSISDVIRTGTPLPDDLKNAPWGDALASGLRVAWLLDPQAKEYRLNTPLKSRLLYHNNGKQTVVFRVVSWNQSGAHQATDTDGTKIKTQSTDWTTIGQVIAVRLAPGEFTEVIGAGIGVGPNKDSEDWRNTRVGTWIHAKAGDEVTFTPAVMTTSGNDGRQQEVENARWWSSYITQRLERDSPLPDDDQERERILIRAVGDLFGEPPTSEEIKTFLADKSPEAITSLAKRLSERAAMKQVFTSLQSGSTTFRVLPIDPEAKNKPRLAIGPGRYELGDNTRLVIVGRGKVMDAKLEFSAEDATTKTHPIKLPDGRGNWAIAWKRDLTEIWIAEPGVLRRVDFANTDLVTDVRFVAEDRQKAPQYFLDVLQPIFEKKLDLPPAAADSK